MDAIITGETEKLIGLSVVDNNEVEHIVDVNKADGSIPGHQQDGYPDDPSKRTPAGNEHVKQARRFAQFFVYRKRGYDTLPAGRNPDRIEVVRRSLDRLDSDAFEALFGEFHQQFASHYDDIELVIEPPIDIGVDISGGSSTLKQIGKGGLKSLFSNSDDGNLYYRQTIYLGLNASVAATLIENTDRDIDIDETAEVESLGAELWKIASQQEIDVTELFTIDDVGGLHALYEKGVTEQETDHDEPFDRAFDARLELSPVPPESLDKFKDYLVYHLACQIRDCYLTMGIAPPAQYRTTGPGFVDSLRRYVIDDVYQPYQDPDAEITDWQEDHTPNEFQ